MGSSVANGLLHRKQLKDFEAYCESTGWVKMDPVGMRNVVLFMGHPNLKERVVVSDLGRREHLTITGLGINIYNIWRRKVAEQKVAKYGFTLG